MIEKEDTKLTFFGACGGLGGEEVTFLDPALQNPINTMGGENILKKGSWRGIEERRVNHGPKICLKNKNNEWGGGQYSKCVILADR